MSSMVWDETGARYYETGVSKGILFPIDGSPGVPWNGLVSVNIDPQGGSLESYYFDGVKYFDKILAEDYQATIVAISTPREFDACEGVQQYDNGAMTPFNKRDKFHMVWRTEIGSDEGESVGYKIHIAYNNLVQPSAYAYQTIADTPTMGTRTFVVTATPACGRHSYFWYDSRDYDLTELEALLAGGILPKCYELSAYANPIGGGGGTPTDPDDGCPSFLVDFEQYVHGQTVSDSITIGDPTLYEATVYGLINNGLDIIELPAGGAFAANDSAASEVGTSPTLTDDDDATYITSADGDLGYTVGLPPLVGYVDGCAFELHIRMSISGGVNPDDPDNMDADAQVHISTDADGDLTIGGFSDGTDEGMGFALSAVDGTIVDYVVPLDMDAWVDTTIDDVVTALEAGAYLNVVGVTNNNTDTTPTVNVYEAKVVMLNDTDPDKYLRVGDPATDSSYVEMYIHDVSDGSALIASHTSSVDFKITEALFNSDFDGFYERPIVVHRWDSGDEESFVTEILMDGGVPKLQVFLSFGTTLADAELEPAVWYTLMVDNRWSDSRIRLAKRDDPTTYLIDYSDAPVHSPMCWTTFTGGMVGDSDKSFEVALDNAKMQVHCRDEEPPPPDWTCFDLSTAVFFSSGQDGDMEGEYVSPVIKSKLVGPGDVRRAQFYFPGFVLDPTKTYEFKAVYAAHTYGFGIYQQNPSWTSTFWSDNKSLVFSLADTDGANTVILTVGPGLDEWDDAIAVGYQTLIRFDMATNGDTGAVDGANLVSLCYREV